MARPAKGEQPLVILDTLGKVMPAAYPGESAYQRDYRMASALKAAVDEHPGAALLVNHHDRKANADDFVDSVSGTHGIAGAADTILVLAQKRDSAEGLLQVTGRDVADGEYAVEFGSDGTWSLTGRSLEAASPAAQAVKAEGALGDTSLRILWEVASHPEGIRPKTVAEGLGIPEATTTTYLSRLYEAGKITKPSRGIYAPQQARDGVPGSPVPPVRSVRSVRSEGEFPNGHNTTNAPTEGPPLPYKD